MNVLKLINMPVISYIRIILLLISCGAVLLPSVTCDDPHAGQKEDDRQEFRYADITVKATSLDKNVKPQSRKFQGKFGIYSRVVNSLTGIVYQPLSSSKDGKRNNLACTKITSSVPSRPWIALVERGMCNFTDKIKHATKNSNASAVVIYNNITGRKDFLMDHMAMDSVSIVIEREDGMQLVKFLQEGYQVSMTIDKGNIGYTHSSSIPNGISQTSVLFVTISFIVLMVISLVWLVFYYIQRFRYSHAKERLARRLACAAKKAIAKIPQRTVKVGDKELDSDFDQCAVCIEPYKAHDVIRILACRHVFHKSCVDPWLLDQRTCPMCKMDILRAYGLQIGGSQESVHHDVESGHNPNGVYVEPEVSSSIDEGGPPEEVKVLLVPHTCLHLHMDAQDRQGASASWMRSDEEEEDEDEEAGATASSKLIGATGGADPSSPTSPPPSSSSSKQHSRSRVGKSNEEIITNEIELMALIAQHGDIRDVILEEDEEEEEEEEEEKKDARFPSSDAQRDGERDAKEIEAHRLDSGDSLTVKVSLVQGADTGDQNSSEA